MRNFFYQHTYRFYNPSIPLGCYWEIIGSNWYAYNMVKRYNLASGVTSFWKISSSVTVSCMRNLLQHFPLNHSKYAQLTEMKKSDLKRVNKSVS